MESCGTFNPAERFHARCSVKCLEAAGATAFLTVVFKFMRDSNAQFHLFIADFAVYNYCCIVPQCVANKPF